MIEDGGANDDDRVVNSSVADPGGIAVFVSDNNAPLAQSDQAKVSWNTPTEIDVLLNDTDADGDTLILVSATADIGTVAVHDDTILVYTPKPGFSGRDSISYIISDGNRGSDSASVAVTVVGNRAPGAFDDYAETDNLTVIDIDVLSNDIDVDGDALTVDSASAEFGTVSLLNNNLIRYEPDISFSGLDTIVYQVSDANGAVDTAVVSVFVDGNESPLAVDDNVSTEFETSVVINVLANDSDPDGDELTIVDANANNGSVVVNIDDTLTYTPDIGFSGADVINYTVSDGLLSASARVNVTVNTERVEVIDVRNSSGGSLSLWILAVLWIFTMCNRRFWIHHLSK